MLPQSAFRNRHKNRGRPPEKSIPAFLKWLRGRPCYIASLLGHENDCSGRVRACHVDGVGGKGIATKVGDQFSIPMCDGHHHEQHAIGWKSFQLKYSFVNFVIAEMFFRAWANTPMGAKWIMERDQ